MSGGREPVAGVPATLAALTERAGQAGQARAARCRAAVAVAAGAVRGVTARVDGADVVLEGRGLRDRWLREAALRDLARTAARDAGGTNG